MTDKNQIKAALSELLLEEKNAAEKTAAMKADAFELGMHRFLKSAGVEAPEDIEVFFKIANEVAADQAAK